MHFGPTSLRLTSVLAKGLRRPKLRADLKVSQQKVAGETSYVVKTPDTQSYANYGEYAYELLELCDGTRTAAEIAAAMTESHPDQPVSEGEVADFLDTIEPATWERSLGERNLAILEKIRDERKHRVDTSSILYIYFSAWDPDKFLERIHPYLSWIYTRGFVIFSLILFATTAAIVAGDFPHIRKDTLEFYNFTHKTAYDLWIFWFLLFVISGIHEFGHGLTCKHFGGEVHQMGFMLIYFSPSFYTDCTDMHLFDRTSKRLWTIFGGIWIELVACGFATLVWFLFPPGSFIGDLGYKTLLLTGVSGVFVNLNPLMKFDGYYALSQYLEMDSLREDSFAYLNAWVQRYIFRQSLDLPPASRRKARLYLAFGAACFTYGLGLLTLVTLFMKNVFTSRFGNWGYLLTAGALGLILRKRLNTWASIALAGFRKAKEAIMAWRLTRAQEVGSLAVIVFLFAVPTSTKVSSDFLLESGERAEIRAPVPGWVAAVPVRQGEAVQADAVLAVLNNPDLETRGEMVQREFQMAERSLMDARAHNDLGRIQKYSRERERLAAEWAELSQKKASLVLRAPIAGVVITPLIHERVGEYLSEGEEFMVLANREEMRARVLVRDWELEDVFAGAQVKLNVRAFPFRSFRGTVRAIMPAAAGDQPVSEPERLERGGQELTNYFAVVLEFPNSGGVLKEGMTGTAKVYGNRYPIAFRAGRALWRWIHTLVW